MEQKILDVLRRMQTILDETQLKELKSSLQIIFSDCKIIEENKELLSLDSSWQIDLEDFLISKTLAGKSESTIKRYRYELNRLLSYINKPSKNILDTDILKFMSTYKSVRNVSNRTLKNVRAIYNSFFVWLRDKGRISKNPILLVEDIKVEVKIRKPYTDTEKELLFRACTNIREKAMLECLYSTAIRVTELVSLNRSDIRLDTKEIVVFGKGGKERTTYLNEKARMYLNEYLNTRTDNNPALFVSSKFPHERLGKNGIENIIRELGKKVGVCAHPHRFRRTAATNALNRGMPIQEVSKLLGHTKLETTMMYCTVEQESVQFHHKKYLSA